MIAAAITGGDVILEGCDAGHLDALVMKLKEAGIVISPVEGGLRVQGAPEINSVDVRPFRTRGSRRTCRPRSWPSWPLPGARA